VPLLRASVPEPVTLREALAVTVAPQGRRT
jgi:hypothetical protein